jgi:uncharacterized membrane protein YtjA (UPF0391 family)
MGLLGWALIVLTVAGVAAIFGFGIDGGCGRGLLFFLFLAIFVVLFIAGMLGSGAATA